MRYAVAVAVLLMVAGCAAHRDAASLPPVPPRELQSCPAGAAIPSPPPAPRSVNALLGWAIRTERALIETGAARRECADRLTRLNEWIVDRSAR